MVTTGKIFKLREPASLPTLGSKLKDFKREEAFGEEPYHFTLLSEIQDLRLDRNTLQGVFSQDLLTYVYHRGERIPVPRTIETFFAFNRHRDRVLLTVLEKKLRANNIANQLSEILFITTGHITKSRILPEVLRSFHEQNAEDTKIVFFDDVDIPNINKLSLYGSSLLDTTLYDNYLRHGNVWYVVIKSKKHGHIAGVTRNGVVVIFNRVDEAEYLRYVTDEVFPLIQ
ncbi:MAG: hypothetical protein ACE5Z5_13085 [Candidatus Bathyarchaeia archaeon]